MNTTQSFGQSFGYRVFALALGCAVMVGCQQELISRNPQSRAAGMREFADGNYADAAGSFRNAIRSDPRDYKSQFYLAQCYENLKQYQQAIQAYKASLDAQPSTLAGREDEAGRLATTEALAGCISKSDNRDAEINAIETSAKANNSAQDWLLLGKIHQKRGDADSALDAFNRAFLINPKDFIVAKQYGLYLEQVGQKQKAQQALRKAYTMNPNDEQVNMALRRLNVVPGPGLKAENQLVKPPLPEGPLPEVDLSNFRIGGSNAPAEPVQPRQPAVPQPSLTPPPPPTAAPPPAQERALSGPRD